MPGIYVHIPFCRQACSYCDFHFSTQLANARTVIEAIAAETALRHTYLEKTTIDSIYFGGGTPSLLTQAQLALLFESLARYFTWNSDAEITLEANPDDIDTARLQEWRALGINRLSIGLQSFNDAELRWMNRAHTAAESLASVKLAQDHGFHNLSIDLIYGSKFQDLTGWEETLKEALDLNTPHISSYNLTIEQKTVLGVEKQKGQEPAVDDALSSRQFLLMVDMLEAGGFIQYEISNFGKAGFFATHNSNYWLGSHYLGLGPSAHSFNGSSRQWNVRNNAQYVKAIREGQPFFEKEELSLKDRYNEYVLTRLRTIWGCDINEIEQDFGKELATHFKNGIQHMLPFVEEKSGVFVLNKKGKLQADGLAADLFLL